MSRPVTRVVIDLDWAALDATRPKKGKTMNLAKSQRRGTVASMTRSTEKFVEIDLGEDGAKWGHGFVPENAIADMIHDRKGQYRTKAVGNALRTVHAPDGTQVGQVSRQRNLTAGKQRYTAVHHIAGTSSTRTSQHDSEKSATESIVKGHKKQAIVAHARAKAHSDAIEHDSWRGDQQIAGDLGPMGTGAPFKLRPGEKWDGVAQNRADADRRAAAGDVKNWTPDQLTTASKAGNPNATAELQRRETLRRQANEAGVKLPTGAPKIKDANPGRLATQQEANAARDEQLVQNAQEMYGSDMSKWPKGALRAAAKKGNTQAQAILAGAVGSNSMRR